MMKNILIIDDNKLLLELMGELLEINYYNVFLFDSLKSTIDFYTPRYKEISLILLDMQLLDANHIQSITALIEINYDTPIIGMSGGIKLSNIAPQYQMYLRSFLAKPFTGKDLIAEVLSCAA